MKTYTKYNSSRYVDQLECEADGLELLAESVKGVCSLQVPQVLDVNQNKIITQYLESITPTDELMAVLGAQLAILHKTVTSTQFGYHRDNYIGLNSQPNQFENDWGEFFYVNRIFYQISLISSSDLRDKWTKTAEKYRDKIVSCLNSHRPSAALLHGDLWKGNVLFTPTGPALIDPAVYFGDREAELAMCELFGGFSQQFYNAYHEQFPLSSNWELRKPLYKLYHLLNHYNIFGASYLSECEKQWEVFTTSL